MNTIIYVGLGTLVNMVMTIRMLQTDLYFKNFIMVLITITMFFGGGLIPWFLLMKDIGLYNNLWAMILPTALSTWNIIILRTGFQSIPRELEEAALIDASQANILITVILPLSKATLAVIFLYYLVGNWNSWFNAMVLLKDRELFPLQLLMKEILVANDSTATTIGAGGVVINSAQSSTAFRELVKYCAIVVSTVPILMVYPFLQKYFVKGVYVGSIKG